MKTYWAKMITNEPFLLTYYNQPKSVNTCLILINYNLSVNVPNTYSIVIYILLNTNFILLSVGIV